MKERLPWSARAVDRSAFRLATGKRIVVTKGSKRKIGEGCDAARRGIWRVGGHGTGGVAAGRCRDAGRHSYRDQNRPDHAGASKFADIAQYPQATVGVQAPFRYEARLYARYALAKNPNAKFAVISQNDDFGRDYLLGLKDVLGERYDVVVTGATYEISDPTIDSQIVKLKASGADVFVIAATPKFAAQAIRKAYEIGWRPLTFLSNVAVWISTVMQPAGLEAGIGILSTAYVQDPDHPGWNRDPGVMGWGP